MGTLLTWKGLPSRKPGYFSQEKPALHCGCVEAQRKMSRHCESSKGNMRAVSQNCSAQPFWWTSLLGEGNPACTIRAPRLVPTPPHTGVVCRENQASDIHPMAATLSQSSVQSPVSAAGTLSTGGEVSKAGTFSSQGY